jgi:hypothetical protein
VCRHALTHSLTQGSGRVFHEGEMGLTLKEARITNGQEVHAVQATDGGTPQVCALPRQVNMISMSAYRQVTLQGRGHPLMLMNTNVI